MVASSGWFGRNDRKNSVTRSINGRFEFRSYHSFIEWYMDDAIGFERNAYGFKLTFYVVRTSFFFRNLVQLVQLKIVPVTR